MKYLNITLVFSGLLSLVPLGAQAAHPAESFRNLSDAERASLAAGQTIFRQPSNWRDLCVPESAGFYKDTENTIRKGGHNYVGEVVLVVPTVQAEALLPRLRQRLLDFEGYAGVPYWSTRWKKHFDLFDWVRVSGGTDAAVRSDKGSLETLQFMEPFGEYGSVYHWDFRADTLTFSGVNTSHLSYESLKAVSPGNLIWRLHAYRQGDYWVFYGLGAVKAFDMLGVLRDRLSASFMGRIEAFFRYVYS